MKKTLKKLSVFMMAMAISGTLFAQVPQKFNYQGIARDNKGNPLVQQRMTLKLTILPTSDATEGEYEEIQTVTTNEFGLYHLQIGVGNPLKGEMKTVKWETGNKYIKVAIDSKGGNEFVEAGTTQLLSVPYAIYADKAGMAKSTASSDRAGNVSTSASGTGTVNFLSKFTAANTIYNSQIFDNGTNIGIGTISPSAKFQITQNSTNVLEHIRMQNISPSGAGRFTMYSDGGSNYATFTKYGSTTSGGYAGIVSLYPFGNLLAFGNNGLAANDGLGRFLISTAGNVGISIFKNGTSKLKFHADFNSENVGIGGNASPASRVHFNNTDGSDIDIRLTNIITGHTAADGLEIEMQDLNARIINRENAPIIFGTNNIEKARLTSNGFLGIGTTVPATTLDVNGQIKIQGGTPGIGKVLTSDATGLASWTTITGVTSVNGNTGAVTTIDGTGSVGYVPHFTAPKLIGNSIIKIDSARVGINTATPHGEIQLGNNTNNRKVVLYEAANNNSAFYGFGVNSGILRFQIPTGANYAFYSQAGNVDVSNEIMRLTSSGNLGLGTNLPTEKLTVFGNALIGSGGNLTVESGNLTVTTGNAIVQNGDLSVPQGEVGIGGAPVTGTRLRVVGNANITGSATVYSNVNITTGDLSVAAGDVITTAGDVVASTGDVIIGTAGELKMGNGVSNRKLVMYEQAPNVHQFYGFGVNAGMVRYQIPTTASSHVFYAGTSTTASNELVRILGNGNVGIGLSAPTAQLQLSTNSASKPTSSSWTISSDARLKTVDGVYTKGLSEILKLNTIAYHYKKGNARNLPTEEQGIGFVAQELQQVFPEAVKQDSDGYLSVDIHPVLISYINAIKELNENNEQLKKQVESQQNQYNQLLKRLDALEKK